MGAQQNEPPDRGVIQGSQRSSHSPTAPAGERIVILKSLPEPASDIKTGKFFQTPGTQVDGNEALWV
jgi:hypothetical protein